METMLMKFEGTERALAEARTIIEVKNIRDQAEALRQYVKQANLGLEIQNRIAEIKIRAERRGGEMINELIPYKGGRPPKNRATMSGFSLQPKLEDFGISPHQSKRWRKEASVPEIDFIQHVAKYKAEGKELTSQSVIDLADKLQRHGDVNVSSACEPVSFSALAPEYKDCLYVDEWLAVWNGDNSRPPFMMLDTVTVTVSDGNISQTYILAAAPGFSLHTENSFY